MLEAKLKDLNAINCSANRNRNCRQKVSPGQGKLCLQMTMVELQGQIRLAERIPAQETRLRDRRAYVVQPPWLV